VHTRHDGGKEASVARRDRTRRSSLEMRLTFEPSWVSPACLVQAYERVVPITRRTTPGALPPRQKEATPQRHSGGRKKP
jgi:hypothetical protein